MSTKLIERAKNGGCDYFSIVLIVVSPMLSSYTKRWTCSSTTTKILSAQSTGQFSLQKTLTTKKAAVNLEDRPANVTNKKARVDVNVRLVSSSHQPTHMASPRSCALCSSKKNPVRSRWKYDVCDVALCLRSGKTCFNDFHSLKQL